MKATTFVGEQAAVVGVATEDFGREAEARVGGGGDVPVVVGLLAGCQPPQLRSGWQRLRLDGRLQGHLRHRVDLLETGLLGGCDQVPVLGLVSTQPDAESPLSPREEVLGSGDELAGVKTVVAAEGRVRDCRMGRAAGAEGPALTDLYCGVGIEFEQLPRAVDQVEVESLVGQGQLSLTPPSSVTVQCGLWATSQGWPSGSMKSPL